MCLRNNKRTLQFGILACGSGTSTHIYRSLHDLLDAYNACNSIQVIITDTTAVNTGCKNGVIARLQRKFREKRLEELQYIGCQHHILDLILRHLLNFNFQTQSRPPSIEYEFVEEILEHYGTLQNEYMGREVILEYDNQGRRDRFKFLFDLCEAYKCYKTEGKWPTLHGTGYYHFTVPDRTHEESLHSLHFSLPNWRDHLMELVALLQLPGQRSGF